MTAISDLASALPSCQSNVIQPRRAGMHVIEVTIHISALFGHLPVVRCHSPKRRSSGSSHDLISFLQAGMPRKETPNGIWQPSLWDSGHYCCSRPGRDSHGFVAEQAGHAGSKMESSPSSTIHRVVASAADLGWDRPVSRALPLGNGAAVFGEAVTCASLFSRSRGNHES